ncbi:MAG: alpha/beta fold hydrolase [Balneolaceae bacterium]|nr:alpha/beta fold hydrolase [Balneolaceae bacterium]
MNQNIRFCTGSDDVTLAYATSGEGPPLVRVANWLTHLDLDWKGPLWSHWFREFSKHHTLIRFDQRGTGLSDRLADDLTMNAWVRDLETVVDDLGIERFPLLGFCQGGAIALSYAVRHPERVSHLILFDSYYRGDLVYGTPLQKKKETKALTSMIEAGWGREDTDVFRRIFSGLLIPEGSEQEHKWLAELQRQATSPAMAARLWEAYNLIDIEQQAKQVTTPTLVFHVKGDKIIPFEDGRRLASLIPEARFVPLKGENHIILESEPAWEQFLAEVKNFIGSGKGNSATDVPHQAFPDLTAREVEVLELISKGYKNTEIADELYISPKTVRNHVTRIFSKMQVDSRGKAIVLAREAGFGKN